MVYIRSNAAVGRESHIRVASLANAIDTERMLPKPLCCIARRVIYGAGDSLGLRRTQFSG